MPSVTCRHLVQRCVCTHVLHCLEQLRTPWPADRRRVHTFSMRVCMRMRASQPAWCVCIARALGQQLSSFTSCGASSALSSPNDTVRARTCMRVYASFGVTLCLCVHGHVEALS